MGVGEQIHVHFCLLLEGAAEFFLLKVDSILASTQRRNDVLLASMRRHYVASSPVRWRSTSWCPVPAG